MASVTAVGRALSSTTTAATTTAATTTATTATAKTTMASRPRAWRRLVPGPDGGRGPDKAMTRAPLVRERTGTETERTITKRAHHRAKTNHPGHGWTRC